MKMSLRFRSIAGLAFVLGAPARFAQGAEAAPELSKGIEAFEEHRWQEAMGEFLTVLEKDPKNAQAHQYVNLIAHEVDVRRHAAVQEHRLQILSDASKQLDESHLDSHPVKNAILDTTQAGQRASEERWHEACEEARMERDLGHLLAANDLILHVLAENPSHIEAQRELSELQSRIPKAIDTAGNVSIEEGYALKGFYAYGQADYPNALAAWNKVHTLLYQTYPPVEAANRMAALHFNDYEKLAQAKVDDEKRITELNGMFQQGLSLYQNGHFNEALELFRQLAIREPEYPQLGSYLVQAESAAERDRTRRLGEEKRQQVARTLEKGIQKLEQEQYTEAEQAFEQVLRLDPSHSRARSYLEMARAEMRRRHDPKAAQMHYEAGLIAYASGKLDEAVREWHMAIRMDPQHEKALNALNKVQKELALYRDNP